MIPVLTPIHTKNATVSANEFYRRYSRSFLTCAYNEQGECLMMTVLYLKLHPSVPWAEADREVCTIFDKLNRQMNSTDSKFYFLVQKRSLPNNPETRPVYIFILFYRVSDVEISTKKMILYFENALKCDKYGASSLAEEVLYYPRPFRFRCKYDEVLIKPEWETSLAHGMNWIDNVFSDGISLEWLLCSHRHTESDVNRIDMSTGLLEEKNVQVPGVSKERLDAAMQEVYDESLLREAAKRRCSAT